MKYCKDCRHFNPGCYDQYDSCQRHVREDIVQGVVYVLVDCRTERTLHRPWFGKAKDRCGPEATYFEARALAETEGK